MDSTPTIKTILIFGLLLWSINLFGQKTRTLFVYGGPSITNVQEIINGEKHFFASPERPYYSLRYHFGICLEENIFSKEYLGVKYGLNFDKRASSHTSFNKYNEDFYGFIGIPLQITYKPLKDRDIQFEAGVSFQYLVYSKYLFMKPFKNFEIDYTVGIQIHLLNNLYFGARLLEPLFLLREKGNVINIDPSVPKERRLYKTHAMQFSLSYKFTMR